MKKLKLTTKSGKHSAIFVPIKRNTIHVNNNGMIMIVGGSTAFMCDCLSVNAIKSNYIIPEHIDVGGII